MSLRRFSTAIAAVAASVLLLSGCATQPGAGERDGQQTDVKAAWLDDGRLIAVVTSGSSSCVPEAEEVELTDEGALAVTVSEGASEGEDAACTRDFVDRVTLVTVPKGVDPAEDLELRVTGDGQYGDVTLPGVVGLAGPDGESPVAATDGQPSAGWLGVTGQFVILTWGSSGCPPVLAEAEVTGAAQVTATFEDVPADQMCTADFAPQTTVAMAQGIHGDPDVELVLTGGTLDATIPLYGVNP